jgi:catechol 2,3-dioxygenase-like lactoylglutathione lyase family enzyme
MDTTLGDFRVGATVAVADMTRARAFYEDALGLRPLPGRDAEDNRAYACGEGTSITLYVTQEAGSSTATVAGWEVTEIERLVDELTDRGVVFEQYDLPGITTDARGIAHFAGDAKVAYFKDPDGNILSLGQAPPG